MKKYTMSASRAENDLAKTNWENVLEVLTLRNQGWTFQAIADKMGMSKQNVHQLYTRMSHLTVGEAEVLCRTFSGN